MIVTADAQSWRVLLEGIRRRALDLAQVERVDLRPLWRDEGVCQAGGESAAMTRAVSFCSVLRNCEIPVCRHERFAGSPEGFFVDQLPAGMDPSLLTQATDRQRARGERGFWAGFDHSLADYPTLLREGVGGLIERIERSKARHVGGGERVFLDAGMVCLQGLSHFISRHADAYRQADRLAEAAALEELARKTPATLQQAMQLVWLTQMAFVSEGRYAMAMGRMDQYLWPFYQADIEAGRITPDDALDLLCHFWVKIEQLGEITNICVGGLGPDGADATNDLTYLMLEATRLVQSPSTNLSARFHDDSPDAYHRACFDCVRTGVGFPAFFNDHVLIDGLTEFGIPLEIACDYCLVGCIETMLAGRQVAWGDSRFNTPAYLLDALDRAAVDAPATYDDFLALMVEEIRAGLRRHVENVNDGIRQRPPSAYPDPFLSMLTSDCIARAKDINAGGAEFNRFHGIAFMGLATVADSLAAIKTLVIDQQRLGWGELADALADDFAGREPLRRLLLTSSAKYGNDIDEVDEIAAWLVRFLADECLNHPTVDGGRFVPLMAANVQNISAGKEIGATPDGRKAFTPLSDAASPAFGRDENGPTAFLASVAKCEYRHVIGGTVVNMKCDPDHFPASQEGARRFGAFTRYFVRERIQQLQFNFTSNSVLLDAVDHPENYENLTVRVSGFSAYFTRLAPEVQHDVIRRRAH